MCLLVVPENKLEMLIFAIAIMHCEDLYMSLEGVDAVDSDTRFLKVLGWRGVHGQGKHICNGAPSAARDSGYSKVESVCESEDAVGNHHNDC